MRIFDFLSPEDQVIYLNHLYWERKQKEKPAAFPLGRRILILMSRRDACEKHAKYEPPEDVPEPIPQELYSPLRHTEYNDCLGKNWSI